MDESYIECKHRSLKAMSLPSMTRRLLSRTMQLASHPRKRVLQPVSQVSHSQIRGFAPAESGFVFAESRSHSRNRVSHSRNRVSLRGSTCECRLSFSCTELAQIRLGPFIRRISRDETNDLRLSPIALRLNPRGVAAVRSHSTEVANNRRTGARSRLSASPGVMQISRRARSALASRGLVERNTPAMPRNRCLSLRAHNSRSALGKLRSASAVWLTLRVKLCGRGPCAEADAARRLPHVSRRDAGGVPPPALVS